MGVTNSYININQKLSSKDKNTIQNFFSLDKTQSHSPTDLERVFFLLKLTLFSY